MIYILLFLFLAIPVIRYDVLARKGGEGIWRFASFVFLVAVAGLRYRVGGDTLVYMAEFDMYPKFDELRYFDFDTARFNPLWYIFTAVSRSINDSFTFFQIIHETFTQTTIGEKLPLRYVPDKSHCFNIVVNLHSCKHKISPFLVRVHEMP